MGEIVYKCKGCKMPYEPLRRNEIIISRFCVPCLVNYGKKKRKTELKKVTTNWCGNLKLKIQEIARLIDYGQPCPSKDTTDCQFHGGHVHHSGSGGNCKYNLHNIHRQSSQSNWRSNDERAFYEGLKKEYGIEYMDFIDSLKQTPVTKLTNDEYFSKYELACKVANRLKKNKEVYSLRERILLRNVINSEIGIYSDDFNIF